ncbi:MULTISPECIES: DUF6980 family protein [unclassified Frankia]|uniref:DUF6980 family protein n=1 Tax=unclassified Frankia TaxID=2632575 RepID=UPI002AD4134B|nr:MULTISPECIES: hypothetical protein [unclassified Frankia]
MTFVDDVLSGKVTLDDIDAYSEAWDKSPGTMEFHEYLGLLWPEYAMWAEEHDVLEYVIEARRAGIGLRDLLEARMADDSTAAALYRLSERYAAKWQEAASGSYFASGPQGTAATTRHCCDMMTRQINWRCDQHSDPFDCPDALVDFSVRFQEYGLIIHDGGTSNIAIAFCPWCGTRLPVSERPRVL